MVEMTWEHWLLVGAAYVIGFITGIWIYRRTEKIREMFGDLWKIITGK